MSKAGERLIQSLQEAVDFMNGTADPSKVRVFIPDEINTKKMREKLGMSQEEFAEQFGFDLRLFQAWEVGRRVPTGVAKNFLILLSHEPELVRTTLSRSKAEAQEAAGK